jgi:small-conductance mechanosensitive channel
VYYWKTDLNKWLKNLPAAAFALLLLACLAGWYMTRDGRSNAAAAKRAAPVSPVLRIDQEVMQTARRLALLADTTEEQDLAREALRLADHELDQAFVTALRETSEIGPPARGPLKELADRITAIKGRISADQARIAQLTPKAGSDENAANQLELAKAELALDQDELDDAQQDLARRGGDDHAMLERVLHEHEAGQQAATLAQKAQSQRAATANLATLSGQFRAWLTLRDTDRQLNAAQQQALNKFARLTNRHNKLESARATPSPPSSDSADGIAAGVARLRRLSSGAKTLSDLNKRIQDVQQLAGIYSRWAVVVETRVRQALRLLLLSFAWVFCVLLAVVLVNQMIRRALGHHEDRRKLHQLRIISRIAVQLVGVVIILLIVFGPPNQVPTIIGLATAGLTVVLKDFIVAFFGWFVLLGKNGIRLGDWVEIEGVGGEVIEIGVLKTYLLEMGNWTSTGHPTGRRVGFINSFAIEGHYFNFSTTGQWLWDELKVTLPVSGDPYRLAEEIRHIIEDATEQDSKQAEEDWQRVTRQYGVRAFSAKPAVDLRPSASGLEVLVRYITRAPQRYEVKSHLFQAIVGLLQQKGAEAARIA